MFLVSGIKEHSRVPLIYHLSKFMFLSSHDEWRRDFLVDEPTSLLDGVCKGNPFVPSKRKAMKPQGYEACEISTSLNSSNLAT